MGNSVSHCEEAAVVPAEAVEEVVEIVEEEPVEEEAPEMKVIKLETAPLDPRFPTVNQAPHCFVKYNEAHKCFAEKGEGDSECERLARHYRSVCPSEWIEKWNELRSEGNWFGKY